MTSRPRDSDPGPDRDRARRDRATVLACFATVLHLALVVCAFGFVSLLADVDVVSRPGTGGLVGPAMLGTAVLVTGLALVWDARRLADGRMRQRAWALVVGMAAAIGYVLSGSALVALEELTWFEGVLFAGSTLTSAFPYLAGALAAVVALGYAALADAPVNGAPRWPWERDDHD